MMIFVLHREQLRQNEEFANILAYHAFIADPKELPGPMRIVVSVIAACWLWSGRKPLAGLPRGVADP